MSKRLSSAALAVMLFIGGTSGCDPQTPESLSGPAWGMSFQEFEEKYRAPMGGEYAETYIVDGDHFVSSRAELLVYYRSRVGARQEGLQSQRSELSIDLRAGRQRDTWSDAQKQNLTYCVSTRFETEHGREAYAQVVAAMKEATTQWSAAANVRFLYAQERDGDCDPLKAEPSAEEVLFSVEPKPDLPADAVAFYPEDDVTYRRIRINWNQLQGSLQESANFHEHPLTLTGTLIHELGHVLGFRHEHISDPSGSNESDGKQKRLGTTLHEDWEMLTPHDQCSAMHYRSIFGPGHPRTCRADYALTACDQYGVGLVYGPPGNNLLDFLEFLQLPQACGMDLGN